MRELRTINFTHREVSTALMELRKRNRAPLPPGNIMDAVVRERPAGAVLPIRDDYGDEQRFEFSEAEVTAALVGFCLERKVLLPAKSEKVLRVIGGNATLVIYLATVPTSNRKRSARR
jgi:hypothetical protein